MSTVHHTKLQINGHSGHCSHLDFHPPPEVQHSLRSIQVHHGKSQLLERLTDCIYSCSKPFHCIHSYLSIALQGIKNKNFHL